MQKAFECFLNHAEQLFEQSELIDDDVDETDLEDELDEDIYLPNCSEVTYKVLSKCIEHGSIIAKNTDGYFSIIYYLGYKTDIYGNKYYSFATSGWFGGE